MTKAMLILMATDGPLTREQLSCLTGAQLAGLTAFALVWAVVYIVSYCWSRRYNERVSTIRRLGFSIIESERIAQHLARAKWVVFRG